MNRLPRRIRHVLDHLQKWGTSSLGLRQQLDKSLNTTILEVYTTNLFMSRVRVLFQTRVYALVVTRNKDETAA